MNDITKPALYAWQDNLWAMTSDKTGARFSFKYKSKIRGHFNNFLDWAEARDYCTNALKTIPLPRNTDGHKEMQIWEECEFTAFIRAVDDIMWRAFFTMLYYTGVRVGELLALSDDCLKSNTLVVRKTIIRKTTDGSLWKVKSTKTKRHVRLQFLTRCALPLTIFFGLSGKIISPGISCFRLSPSARERIPARANKILSDFWR